MRKMKEGMLELNKKWAIWLVAAMLLGTATGCGASKNRNETTSDAACVSYDDAAYDSMGFHSVAKESGSPKEYDQSNEEVAIEEQKSYDDAGNDSTQASDLQEDKTAKAQQATKNDKKKIIKRYEYSYETETFDNAFGYLKQQIDAYDGYISSSEIYGTSSRTLYLTARIPADVSEQFVEQLGNLGTVISQSQSAEDITLQYADTQSRIESLRTEQKRLLALLDKADTLEDIITLENRLTDVRYELENYESQRKLYDDLVDYSTITISLNEVNYTVEVDDSTVLSKIKTGLEKSFRDIKEQAVTLFIVFVINIPYLLIWAIIIFVIVKIMKAIIRRSKNKKSKKEQKKEAMLQNEKNAESLQEQKNAEVEKK